MPNLDVLTLDGWPLDHYTGLALGYEMLASNDGVGPAYWAFDTSRAYSPTEIAYDLMPVLQQMATVLQMEPGRWQARATGCNVFGVGSTVSVAVCRALVVARMGLVVPAVGAPVPDCEDLFA